MSICGENVAVMVGGTGLTSEVSEKVHTDKPRVSRRDRRLVRTALGIMAVLAVLDVVLYVGHIV